MLRIFASIGVIQVFAILSSLIRTKYIAVSLGPEGAGIIGIVDQVVQLTSFVSAFSLPLASIKFLSRAHSDNETEFQDVYLAFLNLLLFISVTAAVGLFILVASPIHLPIGEINNYRGFLQIALFGIPAMMLGGFLSNVFAAAEMPRSAATLSLVYSISLTVAILIGVAIAGITGFYWANVSSGVVITIVALLVIRRRLGIPTFTPRVGALKLLTSRPEILAFAMLLFFASITHSLSFFVARYAILSDMGESGAGLLHALFAIAIAIDMVLTPINGFFLTPRLNRNIDRLEKINLTINFQKVQVLIMTMIVLPFVMFPNLTIFILFSREFLAVAPYLFVFVLAQFIGQMGSVYQSLMIGFDNTRLFSLITSSCWLLFAALSWLLTPQLGFWGVATGFFISRFLMFILSISFLKAKYPIRIPLRNVLLSLYCTGLITVVGYVAHDFSDFSWPNMAVKTIMYLVIVSGLYVFLSASEKQQLLGLTRKLPLLNRVAKV